MIEMEQATCKNCGKLIEQKDIGPYKREYCSDRCRQKAYRERKGESPHRNVELEQRIAALEQEVEPHRRNALVCHEKLAEAQQRILRLERTVEVQRQRLGQYYQQVHNVSTVQEVLPQEPAAKPRKKPAQGLPDGLVNLLAFAGLHRISQNEVRSLLSSGLIHVVRGKWKTESGFVKEALDAQGRHDFWIQFHKHEEFKRCDACPH